MLKIILIVLFTKSLLLAEDNIDEHKASPESAFSTSNIYKSFKSNKFMAVTADHRATSSAVKILESGGTAIDAAISAQMILNLVEPQSSGIGGGAFIIYYNANSNNLEAWDGREKAPLNYREDIFLNEDGKRKGFIEAVSGGLAVGAPPLIHLLEKVHEKHGIMPWDSLFSDAINYSSNGFIVGERLEKLIKRAPHLKNSKFTKDYFNVENGGLKAGSKKLNKEFAKTLEKIKSNGSKAILDGEINTSIIETVNNSKKNPGLLVKEDFLNIEPVMRTPVCGNYRKWKICGMGLPSSGGITVLQILGILNNFNLTNLNESEIWHLYIEASKLAYSDRNYYIADSDFIKVPVSQMLSSFYLKERSKLIDKDKVLDSLAPGIFHNFEKTHNGLDSNSEKPSTTHISIIDRYGNAISMTSSIEFMFGSGLMASGFLLNNQMTDFSFYPKDKNGNLIANRPQPGKKPRSSMSPTIVFDSDGKIKIILGSPGGSRIICYVAASIIRLIDLDIDPEKVTLEANICNRGGKTTIEKGKIGDSIAEALLLKGHNVTRKNMTSGLHIIFQNNSDEFYGVADQRREGAAFGL
tara:strand:- start:15622 stop:17364 length:1743 start_codon:yes stop_codon:yes gene_type:complete